ncbi:hypothetical protein D3C72_1725000 [compost metagenome]
MAFLRIQGNQRHKQCFVNPLCFQHFIAVFQQLALHVHAQAGQQDFLIREIFLTLGAEIKHLFNGSKRAFHNFGPH